MKIVIVTQNAPLYLYEFLDRVLAQRAGDISGVMFTKSHTGSMWGEAKRRLNYYGALGFVQTSGRILANCALGRLPSKLVRRYEVPILQFESVNSPDFIALLQREQVDLVVSIAALQVFRPRVLRAPRLGAINYHTSLLPRHRGRQPLFWALANGDEKTGITIHMIDEKIDTGDIVLQREISIEPNDSLHSLYCKSIAVGSRALLEALDWIEADRIRRQPQEPSAGNYNSFPTRSDRRRFHIAGRRFY